MMMNRKEACSQKAVWPMHVEVICGPPLLILLLEVLKCASQVMHGCENSQ